jgi:hypothetical protein
MTETQEIGCTFQEREGNAFTITEALMDIADADGTLIRDGVSCTISGGDVFYSETFSTVNGYTGDTEYTVTITATIVTDSSTYVEIFEDTIYVIDTSSFVSISKLVDQLRIYISDIGETTTRNVIGMPDGTRAIFRLHHNNVGQGTLTLTVDGAAETNFNLSKNVITFLVAPTLNASILADYTFFEYSAESLEFCIKQAVNYLKNAIDLDWGDIRGDVWLIDSDELLESIIVTAAILEFVQMQMVRLPVAISFGDIGVRISLRGAVGERKLVVQQVSQILDDKIREHRLAELEFHVVE